MDFNHLVNKVSFWGMVGQLGTLFAVKICCSGPHSIWQEPAITAFSGGHTFKIKRFCSPNTILATDKTYQEN